MVAPLDPGEPRGGRREPRRRHAARSAALPGQRGRPFASPCVKLPRTDPSLRTGPLRLSVSSELFGQFADLRVDAPEGIDPCGVVVPQIPLPEVFSDFGRTLSVERSPEGFCAVTTGSNEVLEGTFHLSSDGESWFSRPRTRTGLFGQGLVFDGVGSRAAGWVNFSGGFGGGEARLTLLRTFEPSCGAPADEVLTVVSINRPFVAVDEEEIPAVSYLLEEGRPLLYWAERSGDALLLLRSEERRLRYAAGAPSSWRPSAPMRRDR